MSIEVDKWKYMTATYSLYEIGISRPRTDDGHAWIEVEDPPGTEIVGTVLIARTDHAAAEP